jgi:regulation of enolase protein 1 (concanavalin A-like superfamily)
MDAVGDCRFDRDSDKLIITVPGKDHGLDVQQNRLNAPHLLREVKGDFVIQMRVGGVFAPVGEEGYHRAGFLFTSGKEFLTVQRGEHRAAEHKDLRLHAAHRSLGLQGGGFFWNTGPPPVNPVYLRVERKGNTLRPTYSEDGKKWLMMAGPVGFGKMPEVLKVGVVAEATAPGEFKPEFDQLKLSFSGK